jgi:hypothetical protein
MRKINVLPHPEEPSRGVSKDVFVILPGVMPLLTSRVLYRPTVPVLDEKWRRTLRAGHPPLRDGVFFTGA